MALGGELLTGSSKLVAQPLGVVKLGWKGFDLGKTTEESMISPDTDVKDINYQQDGTKPADHVITGEEYICKAVFGEIKTSLLALLKYGIESGNTNPLTDYADVNRQQYQSMRENHNGPLKIVAVGANGTPLTDAPSIGYFYEAIPLIDGALINWGADTQRNLTVNFKIKWHPFAEGESVSKEGSFGYWGDPTAIDLPVANWPDVDGPQIDTAEAIDAVTIEIVFNENIAFQSAFSASEYFAIVDGDFVVPTAGVILTTKLTLTFPAASFASGDIIKITMSENSLEDTEVVANEFDGASNYPVTNSAP